ncbi:MAG: hypothetical protein H0X26_07885 [Alphaproteobacteria bacterium]|nr:hypothetical protein [Alphaproteobacteria bacterium]
MTPSKNDIQNLTQLGEGLTETIDRFEAFAAQLQEAEQIEDSKQYCCFYCCLA